MFLEALPASIRLFILAMRAIDIPVVLASEPQAYIYIYIYIYIKCYTVLKYNRSGPEGARGVLKSLLSPCLYVHFSRVFDFWMHFGRLGHSLGSNWLPFGLLWLPFGLLWFPFASLLPPFGSLWLPLAPFWLPLAPSSLPLAPFGSFWLHLIKFGLIFCRFLIIFTKI